MPERSRLEELGDKHRGPRADQQQRDDRQHRHHDRKDRHDLADPPEVPVPPGILQAIVVDLSLDGHCRSARWPGTWVGDQETPALALPPIRLH